MHKKAELPLNLLNGDKAHIIIELFFEYSHLKQIYRQGWLRNKIPKENCESVADHSFSVAILSWIIAQEYFPNLDSKKIMEFSLMHDLCEVYAGDITPHDNVFAEDKIKAEKEAVHKLFEKLPSKKSIWTYGKSMKAKAQKKPDL